MLGKPDANMQTSKIRTRMGLHTGLERLRQEGHQFKAGLGHLLRYSETSKDPMKSDCIKDPGPSQRFLNVAPGTVKVLKDRMLRVTVV